MYFYCHNCQRSTVAASRFCLGSSVLTELTIRFVSLADFLKTIALAVGFVGGGWKAQKLLFTPFGGVFSLVPLFNFTSSAFGSCLRLLTAIWRQKCFPTLLWALRRFVYVWLLQRHLLLLRVGENKHFWCMRTVAFVDIIGVWLGVNALVCVSFRHPFIKRC